MGGIKDLIATMSELINTADAERTLSQDDAADRIYRDEPILFTAAQMKSYMPPKYREMRQLAKKWQFAYDSAAKIFYEQARFMEDFEDDFEYHGEFLRYYPTYQVMNDLQLRGYFSWRTQVRAGNIWQTDTSFAFVYIYELLNGIGVSSVEEGFCKLKDFWQEYRRFDTHIDRYAKLWMKDYVVFHQLDRALLPEDTHATKDGSLLILMEAEKHTEEEIFNALNTQSSYNMENSRFFKQYAEDVKTVVYRTFLLLTAYYEKNRKNTLCERFFGRMMANYYTMFESAVVYQPVNPGNILYEINPVHRYRCRNGIWSCERVFWYSSKNKDLGSLFKLIDYLMRSAYGFKSTLKMPDSSKLFKKVVEKVMKDFIEEKKKTRKVEISIDLTQLSSIRKTALETQNKLIVEEEPEEDVFAKPSAVPSHQFDLTNTEYTFLQCLLYKKPYEEYMQSEGVMTSVAADSINEKLFDCFSDTVILYEDDKPQLIEEYIEELKGLIAP